MVGLPNSEICDKNSGFRNSKSLIDTNISPFFPPHRSVGKDLSRINVVGLANSEFAAKMAVAGDFCTSEHVS